MEGWMTFWAVLLGASLAAFAVLAVVVAIGGFFDLLAMFRALRR